ncbi:myosin heavy chain, clone 203-like [Paralichthys olivaceus]|uniref:myosin heavy chain, clone 203-like n=1 Tax=Paralichthys olivaceus TaxID=8255 RepID=UPI003753CE74
MEALQKKLEDSNRREEDLKKSLNEGQNEIQKHKQDNADLRQLLYYKNSTYAENQQMLADTHARYRAALGEVVKERDSVVVHMQRRMDTCRMFAIQTQNAFMEMRKQVKRLEHEVLKFKKELCQLEEEKKKVIANLTDQLTRKDKVIENEKQGRETDKTNAVFKKMEQYNIITKQAESIKDLEKEKQSLNHLLTSTAKRCAVLSKKVEEINVVKDGMRAVGFEMDVEKETNFVLKTGVKTLKRKIEQLEKERQTEKETFKAMQETLAETKQQNEKLTETNIHLTSRAKVNGKELSKKQEEARILGTRLLRVNADIESCARDINYPKKLKIGVQNMKEHYPNSYEKVRVGEETKEDYELRIFSLNQKLVLSEACNQNYSKEVKRLQKQLSKEQEQLYMLRVHFIKLLREKKLEAENLKKELSKAKIPPVKRGSKRSKRGQRLSLIQRKSGRSLARSCTRPRV